jgi:hypothetical protein
VRVGPQLSLAIRPYFLQPDSGRCRDRQCRWSDPADCSRTSWGGASISGHCISHRRKAGAPCAGPRTIALGRSAPGACVAIWGDPATRTWLGSGCPFPKPGANEPYRRSRHLRQTPTIHHPRAICGKRAKVDGSVQEITRSQRPSPRAPQTPQRRP